MEGKDGRTELATPKKRQEERQQGNLCLSPEVTSLAVLIIGIVTLRFAVPAMFHRLQDFLTYITRFDLVGEWSTETVRRGFVEGCAGMAALVAPVFVPVVIGTILGNMAQTKPYFSMKALRLNLGALNPAKGLRQLFSAQAALSLLLGLLKVALVVLTVYAVCRKELHAFFDLQNTDAAPSVQWLFLLLFRISITVATVSAVVALLDWWFKKRQHEKGMMMTKQEVKDERRQHEPNPLIRKAQVRRMRQLTLSSMMAAVPNANVVIVNPDHVAVAIEYDAKTMNAPKVTAKGLRLMAERIKQIARENNIPIVHRPETARALYKHVEIGHPVPASFFHAVAEVLAYLHKLGRDVGLNAA